ncbi:unnamed protein product [Symbiodinium sp. CCMP2592]|nr:unnamed protein product [Symbiodinium sp. CCMP2592]
MQIFIDSMQPLAKDMPRDERKRGFSWLNRQCRVNPEMAAKFKLLTDETAKFNFLQEELLREGGLDVQTSQKYKDESLDENKDRYRTEFPGEDGEEFIKIITAGQEGIPHPQAPNFEPAKRYRVLKDTMNDRGKVRSSQTEAPYFLSQVPASWQIEMSGVVADGDRASLEPALTDFAETLGKSMGSFEELRIKPKKQAKVLTPEEQADKKLQKIFKGLVTAEKKLMTLVEELKSVPYSEELRQVLTKYVDDVKVMPSEWDKKIHPASSLEDKLSAISLLEEDLKPINEGMREARRRIGKAPKQSSDAETD